MILRNKVMLTFWSLFLISCSGLKKKEIKFPLVSNVDIIPKPAQIKVNEGFFLLENDVTIFSDSVFNYENQLLKKKINELDLNSNDSKSVIMIEQKFDKRGQEDYWLSVTEDTVFLSAQNRNGILHGIATLKQLILLNESDGNYFIPQVEIRDWPTFEHRGLLLDCSRHFFNKETIKKYIDLLALYKMNVLHWHLTEDQGWRIEIDKYPKLKSIASKRIEQDGTEYGGIYTKADIREIVKYATTNGIEVIPEIELPGHSQAAIAAYPRLSCTGKQVNVANDWGVFKEIYCAGNDSVFTFLEDVLTELIDLFPSKYIHIGGDEAPKTRWMECAKCQNRIKTEDLHNEHELQAYFIKRIQKFLNSKGKEIIGWDEILEGGLSEGAVVQSWRGFEGGIAAAKQGNKVIMSPTSHAYFDYDLKAINLKKVYHFNPIPKTLDPKYHNLILGGECNMWTEHVPDEADLDYKVFPRMLAMAEVLWSDTAKNYDDFNKRLQQHYPILDRYHVIYGEESIPFSYNSFLKNDSLFVELIPADKNLKLNYQFTHGVRNNARTYTKPFAIETNRTVYVQSFKNEKPYFCVIDFSMAYHKGLKGKINYETDYNQWYTAGGENGLIDGKLGGYDSRDGNWQGFWGNDAKIRVDFDDFQYSKEIIMNFYQYSNSWIFVPKKVEIWHSEDNIKWNRFGDLEVLSKTDPKKRGKTIEEIVYTAKKEIKFKHLSIRVTNLGKVPNWHEAAGSDAWIFMDEIQIK